MRILIVDDHVLFREGLKGLLRSQARFEVVGEAGTVAEAIEAARRLKPDLVMLDFNLPDGTGLDAIGPILTAGPGTKVVFLTVHESESRLVEAVRKGAQGFLLKDMSIAKIIASLEAVERGEPAITRGMMTRIMEEFSKVELPVREPRGAPAELSPRELEVLRELSTGASNQEIADRLVIAENTVKRHVHSLLEKMNLQNRRELAQFARQRGI